MLVCRPRYAIRLHAFPLLRLGIHSHTGTDLVVDASAWDDLHKCPLGHLPNLRRVFLSTDDNEDSNRAAAARLISTLSGSSPNVTHYQLNVLGTCGLVEDAIEGFVLRIKDASKFLVGVVIRPPGLWQLSLSQDLNVPSPLCATSGCLLIAHTC